MSLIGQDSKASVTDRFARHVSSGKAAFFRDVGIDYVFGRREGVYVWDLGGERLIQSVERQLTAAEPSY